MKKYAFFLLAATLTLAACGNNEANTEITTVQTTEQADMAGTEKGSDAAVSESKPSEEKMEENVEKTNTPLTPLNIELSAQYEGEWDDKGPIITADSATIHILDDGYEALKDSLEAYNEMNWQEVYTIYLEHREYAKEDIYSEGTELYISREIEVTRADSRILSFVNAESSYTGGAHGSYYENAEVFDVETGNVLELKDVVTDYDAVYEYICTSLKENYDQEMFFEDYENWLHEMFYEPDGAMSSPLEWNMTMDGMEIRFSPYVLGPWAFGTFRVDIPFEGNEELFVEEYLPVLGGGLIRQIAEEEKFEIDSNRDGNPETMWFTVSDMDEDYHTSIEFTWHEKPELDGASETWSTRYYGSFTEAYLVEVPDESNEGASSYYLYVEYLSENDFRKMYVIDLNANELAKRDRFSEVGDTEASVYGHFIADSGRFALYSRIYTLGTYTGYKTYSAGGDGMPETEDEMYNLVTTGANWETVLISARDLKVLMHEDGSDEKTEEKLPKGTAFRPRRTDGETVMEMELEDGRICDILLEREEGDYIYKINGISEYECFENLPYAG